MRRLLQKREEALTLAVVGIALALGLLVVHWVTNEPMPYALSIPMGILGGYNVSRFFRYRRELKELEIWERNKQELDAALDALAGRQYR